MNILIPLIFLTTSGDIKHIQTEDIEALTNKTNYVEVFTCQDERISVQGKYNDVVLRYLDDIKKTDIK